MKKRDITLLQKLIEINSWTHNPRGVNRVGKMLQYLLKDTDIKWEITKDPNGNKGDLFFGYSKIDTSKPVILLSGHLDTVFKHNWDHYIDGNKFYGPGSMDMKAGLLSIVRVVQTLQKLNKLENILILFTPDEEDGMAHVNKQNEYYNMSNYALVFEEGSRNNQDVDSKTRDIVVGRKALSFYEIKVEGIAGHNAKFTLKDERHSAINETARLILDLEQLANYKAGTLVNTGLISGGISPNAIADEAKISVDIRYGNRLETERFKKELNKVLQPFDPYCQIHAEETLYYPSFDKSPNNEKLADRIISFASDKGIDMQKRFRSSGSEANWISHGNRNAVVLDGFGVVGAGDHSKHEYFLLNSFEDSIELALKTINYIKQHGN